MNEVMFNEGIKEMEAVQRGNPRNLRKGSLANLQMRARLSILKVRPPRFTRQKLLWVESEMSPEVKALEEEGCKEMLVLCH